MASDSSSSSFPFRVVEHTTPCQHIREYPRATRTTQEEVLHLAVKQYIPLDNPNPQPGDVTIIGAHANGFPKELYEPLWEEILARSSENGFRIRSIWMADAAHQGQSGVLNEHALGNDPSWFDHSRDLLHLINLQRDEMPRPIIGIGHSFGAGQLVALSAMHPRLFTTLILLDPAINSLANFVASAIFHTPSRSIPTATRASTYRRDLWPSRADAARTLRAAKFYQSWDPRVFDRWITHGLRELPTAIYPLDPNTPNIPLPPPGQRPVTLTTTLHQEVFTFSRLNHPYPNTTPDPSLLPLTHPDLPDPLDPRAPPQPFYRPEPLLLSTLLRTLRPSTLYIFGATSDMSTPALRAEKLSITGIDAGGNGGTQAGRVAGVTLEGVGHLVPMEDVTNSASESAAWVGRELARWRREEEMMHGPDGEGAWWWAGTQRGVGRMMVDDEWRRRVGPPPRRNTKGKEKL